MTMPPQLGDETFTQISATPDLELLFLVYALAGACGLCVFRRTGTGQAPLVGGQVTGRVHPQVLLPPPTQTRSEFLWLPACCAEGDMLLLSHRPRTRKGDVSYPRSTLGLNSMFS